MNILQINILVKDITYSKKSHPAALLRIGWIFMTKSIISKGEITRSYHFY